MTAATMTRSAGAHEPAGPAGARGRRRVPAFRRRLRSERGQAMVEFALVLPLLVLLVVGMLEFGRAINYWLDVNHLASEGARIAAVDNPTRIADLSAYLRSQATSPELRDGGTSSVPGPLDLCVDAGAGGFGDPVTVKVWTTYRWLPLPRLFGGGAWSDTKILGSATMRLEAPAAHLGSLPTCA